ncbi:MAG: diguanylate cyclase [Actinomycetes bacterium]
MTAQDKGREAAARTRDSVAGRRDQDAGKLDDVAEGRDLVADERDLAANERDRAADERDQAAEARDRAAEAREKSADTPATAEQEQGESAAQSDRRSAAADRRQSSSDRRSGRAARQQSQEDRSGSSTQRESGSSDRAAAEVDRQTASVDRGISATDRSAAAQDALTGSYLRGPGIARLNEQIQTAKDSSQTLCLAFVDVDHLKTVNDSLGHSAGDRLLRQVAVTISATLGPDSLLFRYGGDEFVCSILGSTQAELKGLLSQISEQLRAATEQGSISCGIAELVEGDTFESLVARADTALYEQRRADRWRDI